MRKFMGICLAVALCGLMTACNEANTTVPAGQFKVGVVDLNRLMRDSVPGKAGIKFIEAQQTKLQAELDAIQDNLEKNPTDEAAMQRLQKVYAASQQQIQSAGQNVVGALFDSISGVLNGYREKNGYAMLIRSEALDSFDPKLDVTNAILAEVDKLNIDFKAILTEEAEKAVEAKSDGGTGKALTKTDAVKEESNAATKPEENIKPKEEAKPAAKSK